MSIEETDDFVALVELLRELDKNQQEIPMQDDDRLYLLDNSGNKILL